MSLPKHKRPSALKLPKVEKQPVAAYQNYGDLKPAWRFSRLEVSDPFGWHVLDETTLHYVREKLSQFETMTMNEIFVVGKKQNHAVPVTDLCAAARERLWKLNLEDLEQIHRLRLGGTERVWGIREFNILSLLWWDPNHEICPSEKHNT